MNDTKAKYAQARAVYLQQLADEEAKEKAWADHMRKQYAVNEPTNLDRYEDGMQGRFQGWYH